MGFLVSREWAAKYNLLWRHRTVVLFERTPITMKPCLLFVWEKATRQAWLWPILCRTIGHMVACELTGDSGGIGKPTHVKVVRPLSCSSSVTVFANMFSKVLCCPRVECKTQELGWSRNWSCAKLVGRTMACARWT